ncbi:dipeptide/oligopeptide/nickel ABC transporter permease/ATP-binding protein [Aminobacter sp. AP02]|uniref:dipeptide/oligopeptide/nickel ABC transporter permease/ATP-binding protein n=1 Tax=Aminobacter sp. AP02 TaxID=2135737 RepID=UPI000D6B9A37|nr:dipeptide/oligopeptide/nickel ABC transporter permease/ATP-binding protein [Aminobacter sp. AP02]PWK60788.1 peptide/nickel transport system permease protein [Aminobacter sp. AP02]
MSDRVLHRFKVGLRRDPVGIVLLAIVVAMIDAILAAPLISALSPVGTDFKQVLLPPNAVNWLGTDDFGRDVFTRLLYGGRTSLTVAGVAVLIVMSIGVTVGVVAGYFGGVVDLVLTKIIDVLLAFPRLVLAIAVAALMGGGMVPLIIAISVVAWPAYARIIRGFTLQVTQEGYVLAARCLGTPTWKILTRHIALNLIGPILVLAMLDIGNLILAVSALSFLGLGVPPPAPEWGAMLNEGRNNMEIAPWLVLAPGLAIFVVVLAANYFGDIVRDSVEGRPVHGPRNWLRLPLLGATQPSRLAAAPAAPHKDEVAAPALDMQDVCIEVTDRRSPYFGRRILNNVSLRVTRGESVGLIGESGSGKSTLAALSLGLTRPPLALTAGSASLFGEDTAGWSWDDWQHVRGRSIALVNQDPLSALNPVLRVGDQIGEVMQTHLAPSRAALEDRLREVLDEVDLPRRVMRQFPHELSGGMRQRAVIAMAIVNRPALLIADEPTTALDVSTQIRILDLLRGLQDRYGLALLFVSHDLRVISRVADRVVIMRGGEVMERGLTKEIFAGATHPYTRELIAAMPGRRMRLIQAAAE